MFAAGPLIQALPPVPLLGAVGPLPPAALEFAPVDPEKLEQELRERLAEKRRHLKAKWERHLRFIFQIESKLTSHQLGLGSEPTEREKTQLGIAKEMKPRKLVLGNPEMIKAAVGPQVAARGNRVVQQTNLEVLKAINSAIAVTTARLRMDPIRTGAYEISRSARDVWLRGGEDAAVNAANQAVDAMIVYRRTSTEEEVSILQNAVANAISDTLLAASLQVGEGRKQSKRAKARTRGTRRRRSRRGGY